MAKYKKGNYTAAVAAYDELLRLQGEANSQRFTAQGAYEKLTKAQRAAFRRARCGWIVESA